MVAVGRRRVAADVAQASFQAEAARQRLLEFDAVLSTEVTQRSLEVASGRARWQPPTK